MNRKLIYTDLEKANLHRVAPKDILNQVNSLADYIRDIEQGIFQGLRVEQLEDLEGLLRAMIYIMDFQKPEGSPQRRYFADFELPDFSPEPAKKQSKKAGAKK